MKFSVYMAVSFMTLFHILLVLICVIVYMLLFDFINYVFLLLRVRVVMFMYSYCYVSSVLGILFHCVILCIVCV